MRLMIKEVVTPIKTINIRGETISFIIEGSTSFMIRAYNQQNAEVGNMNVIPWKNADPNEPTYIVKYTQVAPEYRKQEGDSESIAKTLYTLAQSKVKELGGKFFASDSRLSPDSSRNWEKLHAAGKAEIIPDPKGKGTNKQRYRVAIKEKKVRRDP